MTLYNAAKAWGKATQELRTEIPTRPRYLHNIFNHSNQGCSVISENNDDYFRKGGGKMLFISQLVLKLSVIISEENTVVKYSKKSFYFTKFLFPLHVNPFIGW